jgi:hypothetical protein
VCLRGGIRVRWDDCGVRHSLQLAQYQSPNHMDEYENDVPETRH